MENKSLAAFYITLSQILLGIISFAFILYIGRDIIVPLVFSFIFAILLNPLVNFLNRIGINHVVSIFIALITSIIIVGGILFLISSQASMFSESFPQLKEKFTIILSQAIQWVSEKFNVSTPKINTWLANFKSSSLDKGSAVIGQTLTTVSSTLVVLFLIPVYIFMILFYKPLLLDFIAQLFPKNRHKTVVEVLGQTKTLIQSYLAGLLIEAVIMTILNSTALLIIGIQYAILLGIIGAILNVIPYIGGLIAIGLTMLVAFATKSPTAALWVLIAHMLVQFIDNHYIVPYIVASRVKINALISIIVVLIGGALWGVPGMFLSIPLTAIIKVIFDHIDGLKPFGFLLGDTMPPIGKNIFKFGNQVIEDKTKT